MRLILSTIALILAASSLGRAQQWEIGGLGGFGWYRNSTIRNSITFSPPLSAEVGFPSRGTFGAFFGQNPHRHWGGEVRWLYQSGGPQIELNNVKTSMTGYSNLFAYDVLAYPLKRESGFRPYIAGGVGVKAYTGTGFRFIGQESTAVLALLRPVTEAEVAIGVGGGLKYLFGKHVLVRVDFRTYFTPTPDDVIRRTRFTVTRGWLHEFVPTAGLGYAF